MPFDSKCYDLAKSFCEDLPRVPVARLAQTIQDAIEDFLQDEDNFPPSEPFDTRREREEWLGEK